MKSRERVIRAIEMTGPDRVSISHTTLTGAFRRHGEALHRLYQEYPSDCINLGATGEGEFSGQVGQTCSPARYDPGVHGKAHAHLAGTGDRRLSGA
ncbi:MAG: hypothetical protein ACLFV5_05295 [Anaerolineales bacterium]